MRIQYHQTIDNEKILGKFVHREEPEYRRDDGIFIARLDYDLEGLTKQFTQDIESAIHGAGYTTIRTADDKIWVSAPEKFSLCTKTRILQPDIHDHSKKYLPDIQLEDIIKTKSTRPIGLFRRQKPVYNEKPKVTITGTVVYDQLTGVEPTPILDILKKLGYESEVIPTSKEVETIIARMIKNDSINPHTIVQQSETPVHGGYTVARALEKDNEETSDSKEYGIEDTPLIASVSGEEYGELEDFDEDNGDWGTLGDVLGDEPYEDALNDLATGLFDMPTDDGTDPLKGLFAG